MTTLSKLYALPVHTSVEECDINKTTEIIRNKHNPFICYPFCLASSEKFNLQYLSAKIPSNVITIRLSTQMVRANQE